MFVSGLKESRHVRTLVLTVLVGVLGVLVALAGCGSDEDDGGSGAAASAPASDEWQAGGGPEWEKVLAAGRKEAKLVLDASPELPQSDFAELFERDTGIKITYAAGESSERRQTLEQSTRANQLSIDVSLGAGTEVQNLLPAGLLRAIKPQLLLPEVTDPANWKDNEIKWIDEEQEYVLQPTEYVFGWPVVNTDEVESLDSIQALLDPKYKGKIASYDPTSFGSGLSQAALYLETLGADFIKQLYGGQEITYTRNRRQLVEWIARGRYMIALGATQADVESFRDQGLPIDGILPKDSPAALVGGSAVIKQAQNKDGSPSPHPNAATVFINWYLSKPGQEAISRALRDVSRRTDVKPSDAVPDYVIPQEGREYLDMYTADWWTHGYYAASQKIPGLVE